MRHQAQKTGFILKLWKHSKNHTRKWQGDRLAITQWTDYRVLIIKASLLNYCQMDQVQLLMRHLFDWGVKQSQSDRIQLQNGWIQAVTVGEHILCRLIIRQEWHEPCLIYQGQKNVVTSIFSTVLGYFHWLMLSSCKKQNLQSFGCSLHRLYNTLWPGL